ncbi:MAG: hypothetical protein RLZ04_547, partial [Actinomycetota bacterium]
MVAGSDKSLLEERRRHRREHECIGAGSHGEPPVGLLG